MQLIRKQDNRSRLLIDNVVASFLIKGWSAIVVLLMVPLTLKMLGVYSNGVWLTISSILIWIDMMDIGLGNGLRNAVSNYVAADNALNVRKAISSTFFMLIVIVVPLLLIFYCIIWFSDAYALLGINPSKINNLRSILTLAVTLASSTFILKIVGNFYMGIQLPAINNLIVSIGQTLALLLTFIAFIVGGHSLILVVGICSASPLLTWAASIPYTFIKKYPEYRPSFKLIDFEMAKSLFSTGLKFFVLQICGVLLFTTTNILISKMFSPAQVTPYHIAYRYFNIALVIFTTICMPFWNATTDAYARKDIQWIRNVSHKLNLLICGLFVVLCMMTLISHEVYCIWVGTEIEIPTELSISIAVYIFILCLSQRYSIILNGLGILRVQMLFTIIATTLFFPLAIYICNTFESVTSLVCVMCVVNTPGLIANRIQFNRLLNNTATGIWKK